MNKIDFNQLFIDEKLSQIFPEDKAGRFFEALYGDSSEGSYDIKLVFKDQSDHTLGFEFHLIQRPGNALSAILPTGCRACFHDTR